MPRYAGRSSWDQYWHVFEAIVGLNGWDEVTAALQLVAHLEGGGGRSQRSPAGAGISAGVDWSFGGGTLGALALLADWWSTDVSLKESPGVREMIRRFSRSSWRHWLGGRLWMLMQQCVGSSCEIH